MRYTGLRDNPLLGWGYTVDKTSSLMARCLYKEFTINNYVNHVVIVCNCCLSFYFILFYWFDLNYFWNLSDLCWCWRFQGLITIYSGVRGLQQSWWSSQCQGATENGTWGYQETRCHDEHCIQICIGLDIYFVFMLKMI